MRTAIAAAFCILLLNACSHAQSKAELPYRYHTEISGLFIQSSPRPVCQIEASFKGDLNDSIEKFWKDRQSAKLLATGISRDEVGVKMLFASPEVCTAKGIEEARKRLGKSLGSTVVRSVSPLSLVDYDQAHKSLGLLDINASHFDSGVRKECKIDRAFVKEISYEDLIDIRYGMAIPLVFYLHSGDREFLAFDSNCEFKNEFVDIIDNNF